MVRGNSMVYNYIVRSGLEPDYTKINGTQYKDLYWVSILFIPELFAIVHMFCLYVTIYM